MSMYTEPCQQIFEAYSRWTDIYERRGRNDPVHCVYNGLTDTSNPCQEP